MSGSARLNTGIITAQATCAIRSPRYQFLQEALLFEYHSSCSSKRCHAGCALTGSGICNSFALLAGAGLSSSIVKPLRVNGYSGVMKVRIYQCGAALQSAFSFPLHGDKIIAIDFRFRVSLRPHNNGCGTECKSMFLDSYFVFFRFVRRALAW